MSAQQLKEAFNGVASPTYTCGNAYLRYVAVGGTQYQVLEFTGTDADGQPFQVKSDRIKPKGDIYLAARETAAAIVKTKAEQQNAAPRSNP